MSDRRRVFFFWWDIAVTCAAVSCGLVWAFWPLVGYGVISAVLAGYQLGRLAAKASA